jgi:hypothetical protein
MDLMARVTVGSERARQRQEAWEAAAFHEAASRRARADSLADAAAVAARARATRAQAEAKESARQAHWANALVEGQGRRAVEELHGQRAMQRVEAEMLELTPREWRRLANLRRRDFWGPHPRRSSAGTSGADGYGGSAGTSGGQ